ncbi:MAG TPA: DUF6527 family protein [Fermentimonas sp.]|nr:DUF6527 family protein [Fermentimonas sp.]
MMTVSHKFVEYIPEVIEDNTLYISIEFATATHNCVCGCGNRVVTPLSPTDWELRFDGDTVSLDPSIGNWSYDCKSHYWIIKNKVYMADKWDDEEIESNRRYDSKNKKTYYKRKKE